VGGTAATAAAGGANIGAGFSGGRCTSVGAGALALGARAATEGGTTAGVGRGWVTAAGGGKALAGAADWPLREALPGCFTAAVAAVCWATFFEDFFAILFP
jgi:hypothetical protein